MFTGVEGLPSQSGGLWFRFGYDLVHEVDIL